MHQIKLSVIIPNYNNAQFLPQCLDSVLLQTYRDFEIIISDDFSTDNSAEIIKGYAENHSNIKALFNKERLSVSRNRHQAIEASSGEYLTTLDSDDFYFSNQKLEMELKIIDFFREIRKMDVCAFSNIVIVDENDRFIGRQWSDEVISQGEIFSGIFARSCMIPRDFIVSRNLYNLVGGYDPRFNLYEDWDLKIRLARIAEFHFTGFDGIAYRRKGTGLSYVPVDQHIDALTEIWKKNRALIQPGEEEFINTRLLHHVEFIRKNQL
jgi:glycosyltransferase involved in cell wall biosynthesis